MVPKTRGSRLQHCAGVASLRSGCLKCLLVIFTLSLGVATRAQSSGEPRLDIKDSSYHPPTPTIIFDLNFPGSEPSHFSIAVNANGEAGYQSNGGETDPVTAQSNGDPNIVRFAMSEAARNHLFNVARKLNYFAGSYDNTRSNMARTGVKTLIFADPARHNVATYNFSQSRDIQDLTQFFQRLSNTMEYGRRIDHDLRFDKLDLYNQLDRMLLDSNANNLAELQAVVPVLRKVSNDPSIMRVARVDADRLIAKAGAPLASR